MIGRFNRFRNWRSVLVLGALLLAIAAIGAQPSLGRPLVGAGPGQSGDSQAQKAQGAVSGPITGRAERFHVSVPLRSIQPEPPVYNPGLVEAPENPVLPDYYTSRWVQDTAVQN